MLYHRNCSRRNMENCGVSSTNQNWIVPTNTPAKVEDHGENFELHQWKSLETLDNVDFHQPKQFGENYIIDGFIQAHCNLTPTTGDFASEKTGRTAVKLLGFEAVKAQCRRTSGHTDGRTPGCQVFSWSPEYFGVHSAIVTIPKLWFIGFWDDFWMIWIPNMDQYGILIFEYVPIHPYDFLGWLSTMSTAFPLISWWFSLVGHGSGFSLPISTPFSTVLATFPMTFF